MFIKVGEEYINLDKVAYINNTSNTVSIYFDKPLDFESNIEFGGLDRESFMQQFERYLQERENEKRN